MFTVDKPFFLQTAEQSDVRLLHPGRIVEAQDGAWKGELSEADELFVEENQSVLVYFEDDRAFKQVAAHIISIVETEPRLVIIFQLTGDPVSAESRQCYRVSTLMLNVVATCGGEDDCRVLDLSASGLCLWATARHELGDVVHVRLRYDGREFSGKAAVHGIRELDNGCIRYGLHHVEDRHGGGDLQRGLQYANASIQRLHLQRTHR